MPYIYLYIMFLTSGRIPPQYTEKVHPRRYYLPIKYIYIYQYVYIYIYIYIERESHTNIHISVCVGKIVVIEI